MNLILYLRVNILTIELLRCRCRSQVGDLLPLSIADRRLARSHQARAAPLTIGTFSEPGRMSRANERADRIDHDRDGSPRSQRRSTESGVGAI